MGGGDQGGSSAASSQQLLEEMKRQQTASQIQGAFNQLGKGIGTQMPYMQQPQQAAPQGAGGQQPQAGPSLGATGALFPGQGGGIAGIDPQQLAAILQRLGYAG